MKITFVSSYLNHHQLSLCEELRKRCDEFYYVATTCISEERVKFGYEDINEKYDFVIRAYNNGCTKEKLRQVLLESDVVIFGSCPNSYIELRMKRNKLSFLYSERFFKKGVWRRFIPTVKKKVYERVLRYTDKNMYVLCASAFLPLDLKLCSFDTDKCLRWGYFPQLNEKTEYPERKGDKLRILWAGRLINLKRAQDAIKAVSVLKKNSVPFTLDFIGEGQCKEKLETLVKRLGLEGDVNFLGSMSPQKVKENMVTADIFLMTSNFYEGWGAVVNEAMSEGCAVIASSAVGAVPFLIKDGENGMVYRYGSQSDLNKKLLTLAKDKAYRESLGRKAFDTIRNHYCAAVAAERLVEFAKNADKEKIPYTEGPVSLAPVIKNRWY